MNLKILKEGREFLGGFSALDLYFQILKLGQGNVPDLPNKTDKKIQKIIIKKKNMVDFKNYVNEILIFWKNNES